MLRINEPVTHTDKVRAAADKIKKMSANEHMDEEIRLFNLVANSAPDGPEPNEWFAYSVLVELGHSHQFIDLETQRIRGKDRILGLGRT